MHLAGPIALGTFDFQVTGEAVNAYRNILGFSEGDEVPITFAARALTEPGLLKKLHAFLGAQVPVHIAQAFEVTETLQVGQGYQIAMELETLRDAHVRLTVNFTGASGGACIVMRSEFLLVQAAWSA